jgi:hypothetical protein
MPAAEPAERHCDPLAVAPYASCYGGLLGQRNGRGICLTDSDQGAE